MAQAQWEKDQELGEECKIGHLGLIYAHVLSVATKSLVNKGPPAPNPIALNVKLP